MEFGLAYARAAEFGFSFYGLEFNQVETRVSGVKASGTEGSVELSLHERSSGKKIIDDDPQKWKLIDGNWWLNIEILNMYGELPSYCKKTS